MSGTRDDVGSARLRPQRRYRLAGAPPVVGADEHVDDLAAAYALGALDHEERAHVERHVRRCPECARLLGAERRVVALLPLVAAPAAPAPDVKVALFARVAHAQRAAAAAADSSVARAGVLPPAMTIPSSRPAPWPAAAAPAAAVPAPRFGERAEHSSWLGRIGAFATVPLLLALIATGAWAFQLQDRVAESSGQVESLEASLANFGSGTQLPLYGTSTTAAGPQGELLIGNDQRQGRLLMRLDPDPNRAYKLVGVKEGRAVPVADLRVDAAGNSQIFPIDQPFDSYEQIQVQVQSPVAGGDADTVLSADLNGAIGADDPTSNGALP